MILREEDDGGRAMVMRDDERVRSASRRLNRDQVMEIYRLSSRESGQQHWIFVINKTYHVCAGCAGKHRLHEFRINPS